MLFMIGLKIDRVTHSTAYSRSIESKKTASGLSRYSLGVTDLTIWEVPHLEQGSKQHFLPCQSNKMDK